MENRRFHIIKYHFIKLKKNTKKSKYLRINLKLYLNARK